MEILAGLTDEQAVAFRYDWPSWARESQLPPAGAWRVWLLLSGRGFGKTRVGAEWVRAQVKDYEHVNLIGPSAADVRDVMVEGESGIMATCHPAERPEYFPSRRAIHWPNGARSLCFSAEDPEQLRGPQHQRLWCDEIAAWANHTRQETWDLAMFGLRLGPDPRCVATTTPKPVGLLRDLVEDPKVIITKGTTYENAENLAPAFFDQVISKYEGTRLGRQELEAELLLDEGLAYRVTNGVHVIPEDTAISNWWGRFEAMDYGTSAPTSWGCFATDHDGNVIAFGLHYEIGYPSDTAPAIHRKRERWWARDDSGGLVNCITYGPADLKRTWGKVIRGKELSAESEFADHGLHFAPAQMDRHEGYVRIAEMLKPDAERPFPDWHPKRGEKGAPRFYILDSEEMQPLIENLRDAPLEDIDNPISKLPGEAVDERWEHDHGHAHAMCRYGLTSRPKSPDAPKPVILDPRKARVAERLQKLADREAQDLISA